MKKNQHELIMQMSDDELKKQLILSQFLFLIIAFILSIFLFNSIVDWRHNFDWNVQEILLYGAIPGLIIVTVDLILIFIFPKHYYDDGGINEKIFKNRSITDILTIALVVAICEELLFRGVIQTTFGYVIASTLFALVHIRYLKKPVLLISVLLVSFYIGFLYELTGNLFVTITAHFIVDFLLGLFIRLQK